MDKIGVIGLGAVGKAVRDGMTARHFQVVTYDKTDGKFPDFSDCEFVFICVPTPTLETGEQDISAIRESLDALEGYEDTVVIKSTVLPGTTQRLQDEYPRLPLVCCPEFLTEATAMQDFLEPDKAIVGYTRQFPGRASLVACLFTLFKCPVRLVPAEVAEMTKYMVNSYYALRVTYANQIYDLCRALGISYDRVRECFELDKRVAPGHFEVFYKGKTTRGYGGKCLPKDVKALVRLAQECESPLALLETAEKLNGSWR